MATFLVALLSFTFGAGVAFGAARVLIAQVRKDQNGLGCVGRETAKNNANRFERLRNGAGTGEQERSRAPKNSGVS